SIFTASQVSSTSNVFNEIMNAAAKKVLPYSKPSTNRNDQLYNDVLELLHSKNLGWEHGTQNSIGISFINKLVSLLYYLDDKHKTLKLRSLKIPLLFLELLLYQKNSYYKNGTHHKTTLRRKELEFRADKLEECILQPWTSKSCWNERIQSASIPARSPEENKVYVPIAERIRVANDYEIISLEEYLPETKEKRFYYLSNFAIDSTI
ncbi:19566_t:CDS:2, partial [Gigaspora rosea]